MSKPLMRIPYTAPLPPPNIIPRSANTLNGAAQALQNFLDPRHDGSTRTIFLTGAGLSVASGLADYRGTAGTYTLNKTYRPIYYGEFISNHEARKRYWARSYLGWTNLHRSKPNAAHYAIGKLAEQGIVSSIITQNVDSFHVAAQTELGDTTSEDALELHGALRHAVCVQCRHHYSRDEFQAQLSSLNPAWAEFLNEMLASGALTTEDPAERGRRGLKSNPDGDVDVPDAPYTTFRYPPCPKCLEHPPKLPDGTTARVETDSDGAWNPSSTAGVLKPDVIMFGESIPDKVKTRAEQMVDGADRMLVVGSSLATYSAYRLAKRAMDTGKPFGVLNMGGVRGEEKFFDKVDGLNNGTEAVRCAMKTEQVLPMVTQALLAARFRSHP